MISRATRQTPVAGDGVADDGTETPGLDVDVFHTAIGRSNRQNAGIDESFKATWVDTSQTSAGHQTLLIGRERMTRPLAIDLKSRFVALAAPRDLAPAMAPPFAVDGQLVLPGENGVSLYSRSKDGTAWESPRQVSRLVLDGHDQYVRHDSDVYSVGDSWYRIRVAGDDVQVERLSAPLPLRWRFTRVANMAHYGLVAWHPGNSLYRVEVHDEPRPLPSDPNEQFASLPERKRHAHSTAVKAIESFGGRVGLAHSFGIGIYDGKPGHTNVVRGYVFLPEGWSGGDDGLSHLAGVANLEELWCAGSAITNDGLRHIGSLPHLKRLVLFETGITSDGLQYLAGMDSLQRLEIEGGYEGREFDDTAVTSIKRLPALTELHLVGRGFTDEGFGQLSDLKTLRSIVLRHTAVTPRGMSEMRRRRPRISVLAY